MSGYQLNVVIPGKPDLINKMLTRNKHERNRINLNWYSVVKFAVYKNLPPFPLKKAHLKFTAFRNRPADYDGLVGSLKPLTDGFVHAKVLQNDTYKITGDWEVTQKPCSKGMDRTDITITERET